MNTNEHSLQMKAYGESFVSFDGSVKNFVLPKNQWNGSRSDGIIQLSPRYIRKAPSPPSPRIHQRLQRSVSILLLFPAASKKTPPTSPRRSLTPRRLRRIRKKTQKESRKRGQTIPLILLKTSSDSKKRTPHSPRLSPGRGE